MCVKIFHFKIPYFRLLYVLFFLRKIHLQLLSCPEIGPCFVRAENDKTRAANESYVLKMESALLSY